jgi:phage terminase large subunit
MTIQTPRWSISLLQPARYKGAYGGRGSGKSHFFAEALVEACVLDPNLKAVCVREIQKSLKFSSKEVIEGKIRALGVSDMFTITQTEIRRNGGNGIIIFQGMQNHTADSIKSLEGFKIAWVEEAQNLSARSFKLLRPTIREQDSELWFSWNPENQTDPVDKFFRTNPPPNAVSVMVNSEDNPFLPETLREERESDRIRMLPEDYEHVWNGAYNTKSEAIIFKSKYRVDYFEPKQNWVPYFGLDWGFSQDPTVAVQVYNEDGRLYIYKSCGRVGLELDDTAPYILRNMPEAAEYKIRADNARPESISYVKRNGLPKVVGEPKLKIEEGITFMRNFEEIIIHPDCREVIKEFGLYSYKVDKRTGDVLPQIVDKYNHYIDAIRYALLPFMRKKKLVRLI